MSRRQSGNHSQSPVHRQDERAGATLRERRNWRIFSAFARHEYSECLQIIEEQLCACNGLAEYPIYVKGESKESSFMLSYVVLAACLQDMRSPCS